MTALTMAAATGCSDDPPKQAGPTWVSPSPAASASPPPPEVPWVGTWGTAVQSGGREFERQTLRQIVHTSIGGTSARLKLSNAFGDAPLTLGAVSIARHVDGAEVDADSARPVTFDGAAEVTIAAGKSVVSDPVAFPVPADGDVAVSVYLPTATGATTQHALAGRTNYFAAGDHTTAAVLPGAKTTRSHYLLAGLDVRNPAAAGAVVAFGASITDGLGSTFGANRRWPDLLADRLSKSGRQVGVINVGISGNRLLADAEGRGQSARKRFDRDVLQRAGARWVIISDNALNDLGSGDRPGVDELTAALRELIDQAHGADIKVICSTLTPYRGAGYFSSRGEEGRVAVNEFVRSPDSGCDGVLDQDKATRDPSAPSRLSPESDAGDHLHPGPAGMTAIARAADLDLFGPPAS